MRAESRRLRDPVRFYAILEPFGSAVWQSTNNRRSHCRADLEAGLHAAMSDSRHATRRRWKPRSTRAKSPSTVRESA